MSLKRLEETADSGRYDRVLRWCDAGGGVVALIGAVLAVIDPIDWRNWGLLFVGVGFIYVAQRGKQAQESRGR